MLARFLEESPLQPSIVNRRDILNLFRNRALWAAIIASSPLLMLASVYGYSMASSVYKTDFGNGMVIYGDSYVKSGRWVFDCKRSLVISREREHLPVPFKELAEQEKIRVGQIYRDGASVREAINSITANTEWFKGLTYVYSVLDESDRISMHKFSLLAEHAGAMWALEVYQSISLIGKSSFYVVGKRYDPETYVDYDKAFESAVKSCPAPQ